MISGFVLILLFPFTRLVHVFAIPIEYLWRPYQVVIWNRDPRQPVSSASAKATTVNVPIAQEPNDLDRRRLLVRLGIFTGSVSAAIVGIPSIAFLLGLRKAPEVWRGLGAADSFQIGAETPPNFGRFSQA